MSEPVEATAVEQETTVETSDKDERLWAMLAHLLGFAGFIVPFGNILGPLVVWLVKKDESAFVNDQAKESLNFQISISIMLLISAMLTVILIGIPLLIGLGVFAIVVMIVAGIRANEGKAYRYPLTFRLIK